MTTPRGAASGWQRQWLSWPKCERLGLKRSTLTALALILRSDLVSGEPHCRVFVMGTDPQMTWQTRQVLAVMGRAPLAEHYGLELAHEAGLKSGTIYPILARLEAAGWITGHWEDIDPHVEGRRPRRYYRLTARGIEVAEDVRQELSQLYQSTAQGPNVRPGLAPA
jgi:PadR family transcriptional regulator PadR